MAELGHFALLAALASALYGIAANALGIRRNDPAFREAGARSVHMHAAFVALAAVLLFAALLTRQFHLRYVAEVTSRELPVVYTLAAFWGGHAGSLLLWAFVLAGYAVAAQRSLRRDPDLAPYAMMVVLATGAFFSATLAFSSNPFETLAVPPPDGRGLNPLLRNPWMAVHPPALYLGFVGMTVPYALAVAALATGRLDGAWVRLARGWMLAGWLFLTAGLLFGAKWSYVVLGWGGYWAWDPVENAALMPWLTATAFLHSIQVHERRRMLAGWTAALAMLSFGLAIFGTFLTRSGLLSSVHSFADSTIGVYLLGFLASAMTVGFGLLLRRLPALRADAALEGVLSREAAFLANNVLLLIAAFAVLLGTIFPILAEAATGDRISVGPPYFTLVMAPIVILLLLLMAVGPLLPWREGRGDALARALAVPGALAVLFGLMVVGAGLRHPGVGAVLVLAVFAGAATVVEVRSGLLTRAVGDEAYRVAVARLVARNRRRYGGYTVHLGFLVLLAGATVSSAFSTTVQGTVARGESLRVGSYEVRYEDASLHRTGGIRITSASVTALSGGRVLARLRPRLLFHGIRDELTADVAIRSGWRNDLYVVLAAMSPEGRATFRVSVNPMIAWLWAGALLLVLGGVLAALPQRQGEGVRAVRMVERPAPVAGGGS